MVGEMLPGLPGRERHPVATHSIGISPHSTPSRRKGSYNPGKGREQRGDPSIPALSGHITSHTLPTPFFFPLLRLFQLEKALGPGMCKEDRAGWVIWQTHWPWGGPAMAAQNMGPFAAVNLQVTLPAKSTLNVASGGASLGLQACFPSRQSSALWPATEKLSSRGSSFLSWAVPAFKCVWVGTPQGRWMGCPHCIPSPVH